MHFDRMAPESEREIATECTEWAWKCLQWALHFQHFRRTDTDWRSGFSSSIVPFCLQSAWIKSNQKITARPKKKKYDVSKNWSFAVVVMMRFFWFRANTSLDSVNPNITHIRTQKTIKPNNSEGSNPFLPHFYRKIEQQKKISEEWGQTLDYTSMTQNRAKTKKILQFSTVQRSSVAFVLVCVIKRQCALLLCSKNLFPQIRVTGFLYRNSGAPLGKQKSSGKISGTTD